MVQRMAHVFSVKNARLMHMGYNNEQPEYVMNDVKLECVSDEKDLRMIVSNVVRQ